MLIDNLSKGLQADRNRSLEIIQTPEIEHKGLSRVLSLLAKGEGDSRACYEGLRSYSQMIAYYYAYAQPDLALFRHYAYLSAVGMRLFVQRPDHWRYSHGFINILHFPLVFLSHNATAVDWMRQYTHTFNTLWAKAGDKVRHYNYVIKTLLLALNQQWDAVRQRCELALANDLKSMSKRVDEYRFMLALANRDNNGMHDAIKAMLTVSSIKARENNISPVYALFSPWLTLYYYMMLQNGFEPEIETPLVPLHLLRQPSDIADWEHQTPPEWDFLLKDFDWYQPLPVLETDKYDPPGDYDEGPWSPTPNGMIKFKTVEGVAPPIPKSKG